MVEFVTFIHPVQVAQWSTNFAPGLKLNWKISAGKYKKSKIHQGQLIFHRGANQQLCLKNEDIP